MKAPLVTSRAPVFVFDSNGHALAHEVERDLGGLAYRRQIWRTGCRDRPVERAGDARFERRIPRRKLEHLGGTPARGIVRALESYDALGQCPRLVGAEDVHAPEIFDGAQAADEHAAARHLLRAARQVHAEDGRQKLRTQSDRKCD